MALSVGAPGAWAPRAALDFLRNAGAALAAGRAKGRSPSAGRSRGVVMVARALNLHLKRRRLCDGEFGRPRDPKIVSALNLHLKRRRVAQVCASYTRARRSRPQLAAFFFANPVGGAGWSSEQLRGRCRQLAAPRQAGGSRTSARSGFRAGTVMALSVGAPGAWAPRAALDFLRNAGAALAAGRAKGRSPSAGRSRGVVMVARALNLHLKRRRLCDGEFGRPRDPKNRQCIEFGI